MPGRLRDGAVRGEDVCFLFAVCIIGGEAKQSAFGPSAKGTEVCNCLHLWRESWGQASSSLGLCPGNPVQENFPFRSRLGCPREVVGTLRFRLGPPQSPKAVGDLDEMEQDFQYPIHHYTGS